MENDTLLKLRIITKRELLTIVPYTAQHILKLEKAGLFPQRIQLGPNRVGWYLIEVEKWIRTRLRGPVAAPQSTNGHSNAKVFIEENA